MNIYLIKFTQFISDAIFLTTYGINPKINKTKAIPDTVANTIPTVDPSMAINVPIPSTTIIPPLTLSVSIVIRPAVLQLCMYPILSIFELPSAKAIETGYDNI